MSWQTPENLSADEIAVLLGYADAAAMNAAIAGGAPDLFRYVRTSTQNGLSGSYAENTILFDSETIDEGNNWTVLDGVATCSNPGRYRILVQLNISGGNQVQLSIFHNSTAVGISYIVYSGYAWVGQVEALIDAVATDTVKASVSMSSGAGSEIYLTTTFLQIEKVG